MQIVIAGASGFLGTHLTDELERRGHAVTRLVRATRPAPASPPGTRTPRTSTTPSSRPPTSSSTSPAPRPSATRTRRSGPRELRESRVSTTRVLAEAIAGAARPPTFLAGNGISWYGDHGDQVLTEAADTRGHALLTEVSRDWQAAADPALEAGARVCFLRTAPVMDARSAPLHQLRRLFQLGPRRPAGRRAPAHADDLAARLGRRRRPPRRARPRRRAVQPVLPADPDQRRVHRRARQRPAPAGVRVRAEALRSGSAPARWRPSCSARSTCAPRRSRPPATTFRDRDVDEVLAAGLG